MLLDKKKGRTLMLGSVADIKPSLDFLKVDKDLRNIEDQNITNNFTSIAENMQSYTQLLYFH